VRSLRTSDLDFARNGVQSIARIPLLFVKNLGGRRTRECNICGWRGAAFYPNTGPGYHEQDTLCPGCASLARHRSLVALLFDPGTSIVEVAPMRGFETLVRLQPGVRYTSFDLHRHAMEQGDLTRMRYATESLDYFVCFHVLEHIPDETRALAEIHRVLKSNGLAVLQVPIDWSRDFTEEYPAPDPRDVGHVRRYGRDFAERLERHGFAVESRSVLDDFTADVVATYGMSPEPIFFALKRGG
jgi:SAM-dependent methyltransferase